MKYRCIQVCSLILTFIQLLGRHYTWYYPPQLRHWHYKPQNQPFHSCPDQTSYVQRLTPASVWCQVERTCDQASRTTYHRHQLQSFYKHNSFTMTQKYTTKLRQFQTSSSEYQVRNVMQNVNSEYTYLDLAAKSDAAQIAASSSTLSWESRLLMMLWWTFFRSAIMHTMLPSVLQCTSC